jgi:DNA adenine methylase
MILSQTKAGRRSKRGQRITMAIFNSSRTKFSQGEVLTTRPFLKWAGGKARLVPEVCKYIPKNYRTYVEPFVGGGALFFSLRPDNAVLADSNEELMNCYEVVRDHCPDLIEELQKFAELPYSEETFYEIRKMRLPPEEKIKQAARMIYLNRTAYNGLYRVNRSGNFNTPFGRYEKLSLPTGKVLQDASKALQKSVLKTGDFEGTLQNSLRKGDFAYIDPPYPAVSKYSDFNRYTKNFFSDEDHKRLSEQAKKLDDRGVAFVLSNANHPLIRKLYEGTKFKIVRVLAPRYINSRGDRRGNVAEVIITNQPAGS